MRQLCEGEEKEEKYRRRGEKIGGKRKMKQRAGDTQPQRKKKTEKIKKNSKN